jgi:hypothetical protein
MVRIVERDPKLSLWMNVLTDVQFWVPVLVLTAGLVLLRAIR